MAWELNPLAVDEVRAVPLTVAQSERLHAALDVAGRGAVTPSVLSVRDRLMHALRNVAPDEVVHAYAVAALAFVQTAQMLPDPPGVDVIAGPVATLATRQGDCLTLCTLYLSLLHAQGITSTLAKIVRACDPIDHVAVLVWVFDGWSWADPASTLPFGQVTTGAPCPTPDTVVMVA